MLFVTLNYQQSWTDWDNRPLDIDAKDPQPLQYWKRRQLYGRFASLCSRFKSICRIFESLCGWFVSFVVVWVTTKRNLSSHFMQRLWSRNSGPVPSKAFSYSSMIPISHLSPSDSGDTRICLNKRLLLLLWFAVNLIGSSVQQWWQIWHM